MEQSIESILITNRISPFYNKWRGSWQIEHTWSRESSARIELRRSQVTKSVASLPEKRRLSVFLFLRRTDMEEVEGASPASPPPLSSTIDSPPHNPSLSDGNEEVIGENGEDHEQEIISCGDGALSDELRAKIVHQVRDPVLMGFCDCSLFPFFFIYCYMIW